MLDDPLPAGLQALDYDLDTNSQASRDAEARPTDPRPEWLGTTFRKATSRREVRDDRVITYFANSRCAPSPSRGGAAVGRTALRDGALSGRAS